MHLARIIGTIVATQKVPVLTGHRIVLLQPCGTDGSPAGKTLAALDLVSAAPGQQVFYVRGREAANALADSFIPVDAAVMGIVDTVEGREIGVLDHRFGRQPHAARESA